MNVALISLFSLALLGLGACSKKSDRKEGAKLASFEVVKYTADDGRAWETLDVKLVSDTNPSHMPYEKNFSLSDFEEGASSAAKMTVDYGSYTLTMNYFDADHKLLFEVCEGHSSIQINQPVYKAEISICPASTRDNSNTSPNTATVTLTPISRSATEGPIVVATCKNNRTQASVTAEGVTQLLSLYNTCKPTVSCAGKELSLVYKSKFDTIELSSEASCKAAKMRLDAALKAL